MHGSMLCGLLCIPLSYSPPSLHQALGKVKAPGHLTVLQDKESLHVAEPCNALAMIAAVRLCGHLQQGGEQAWWNGTVFFFDQ